MKINLDWLNTPLVKIGAVLALGLLYINGPFGWLLNGAWIFNVIGIVSLPLLGYVAVRFINDQIGEHLDQNNS